MATSADSATKKRLALAIIDFLNTSLSDGTLPPDERDSIDVATNCIAESFKVDASDQAAVTDALGSGQNLLSIYTIYEKLKGKNGTSAQSSSAAPASSAAAAAAGGTSSSPTNPGTNAEAETLKGKGNIAMQQKDYNAAVDFYTQAIALSPTNAIYLSNRAAAYSALQKHDLAMQDADMATAADPKYTKAWSRLGLARFALGDAKGSMEAYQKGIEAEGHGGSEAMKKGFETAKRKVLEMEAADDVGSAQRSTSPTGAAGAGGAGGGMPDLASLAGMLGGGGGAGGGGMPDLSQLMNNPMMRQMAQNLMQNPDMMNNLMNNPRLREMANQYGAGGAGGGGGGGMPDISALMEDPSLAEMARNFMGGAGGPPPGGSGGSGAGGGSGT